jgi:NAD(P)-dependent dehydrogenase (short-subunit alcohol dehydrogenase family)
MRVVAPLLKKNPGGSILDVSSTAAHYGDGSSIVYSAAKVGLIGMTRSFVRLLAPEVRVSMRVPGTVATGSASWPPEFYEGIGEQSPLKRLATKEEFAAGAVFLAADASDRKIAATSRGRAKGR